MSKKKKHLIGLYLKCSKYLSTAKENLEANENFLKASFQYINSADFDKIIKEHGVSNFTEEMTSLVDSNFSEEEIQSLIDFFTSPIGRKLVDSTYLSKINSIMSDIISQRQEKISRMDR